MAGFRTIQTSFTNGELDPLMRMRSDTKMYFQGARSMENTALFIQGGWRRRPGSVYKAALATTGVRFKDFSYTEGQSYLFVFSNAELKVFSEAGTLLQTSGSQDWTTAMLPELTFTQSGDTTIVFHEDMWPQVILRTGATTFTITDFAFEAHSSGYPIYQPYFKFAADSVTMTPSATTGSITVTTSADVFDSDHVGAMFRYEGKTLEVTAFTSATQVTATVRETLGGTAASATWDEQAFNDVRGHPRCGAFHDQRLCLGGSTAWPDGFNASKIAAYFNFDTGSGADDDAISVSAAGGGRVMRYLVSGDNIQIMTNGQPLYIPQSAAKPVTPDNMSFRPQPGAGASTTVEPIQFDGASLYVQKTGKVVREMLWDDTRQRYDSPALSYPSAHLISDPQGIAAFNGTDERPESYAFVLNDDGTLAVFMSDRNEEVAGWVPWSTDGDYAALAVVEQTIFVAVDRTIDSVAYTFLEAFDWDVTLDCALEGTATGDTTSWTAAHLPDTEVKLVSGNYFLGTVTSGSGGEVTSPTAVSSIVIGLDYAIDVETMPVDAMDSEGPVTGEKKRIARVVISLYGTLSVSFDGGALVLRQVDDDLSEAPTPAEGEYEFFGLGWSTAPTVEITQNEPLPIICRGLYMEVSS